MITFYGYRKCSTCRNAMSWLEQRGVDYKFIDITERPPSKAQLKKLLAAPRNPRPRNPRNSQGAAPRNFHNFRGELRHLFNTSGIQYREQNIARKRQTMSEEEQLDLLASNGRLIKRPIATDGRRVTVGFKPAVYEQVWGEISKPE